MNRAYLESLSFESEELSWARDYSAAATEAERCRLKKNKKLLFPFCPSTKQAIIENGRNPRFHNRAIDIKFAGEPVNRV